VVIEKKTIETQKNQKKKKMKEIKWKLKELRA
jgi:hypothetical protein